MEVTTFKELMMSRKRIEKDVIVPIVEKMAKDNDGKLQAPGWLMKNGHANIYSCMRKNPDWFSHIDQERKRAGRKPKETTVVAE